MLVACCPVIDHCSSSNGGEGKGRTWNRARHKGREKRGAMRGKGH